MWRLRQDSPRRREGAELSVVARVVNEKVKGAASGVPLASHYSPGQGVRPKNISPALHSRRFVLNDPYGPMLWGVQEL